MKKSVGAREVNGTIQLRFRAMLGGESKRVSLSSGIQPGDRAGAVRLSQAIAAIERDLAYGELDSTLKKYKVILKPHKITPPLEPEPAPAPLGILELFDRYRDYRLKGGLIRPSTAATYYETIRRQLLKMPPALPPAQYRGWFLENYSQETARRSLQLINALYQWAVLEGLEKSNPLQSPGTGIKIVRRPNSRAAFSKSERDHILGAFRDNRYCSPPSGFRHSHYYDVVWFLFYTGCRLEDAVALKWEHISPDFGRINFCTAIPTHFRRVTSPKTGGRLFDCNRIAGLVDFLRDRRGRVDSPWVFPSPVGGAINQGNFGQRVWKPILQGLIRDGLISQYLPPYHCRHSAISYMRWAGMSPEEIASLVGNSAEIIFKHYSVSPQNLPAVTL